MKLYINKSTDPYFNLATEEYLIKNAKDDIIMLWRNSPSVIIGKNQNAYAEINFDFVREHDIKVVRRLTGGGAVFHDLGNVNYTFISPPNGVLADGVRQGGLDFAHFSRPIISALNAIGLNAALSGRNDIVVSTEDGERKISGNAQCVLDEVTMHHGTLLFSAQMERLTGALNVNTDKLKSKGIASVRSRVANILDLLSPDIQKNISDVERFVEFLKKRLSSEFGIECETLSSEVIRDIEVLVREKYCTDDWNLHRFGNFSTTVSRRFSYGTVEVHLNVAEGRISEVEFGGDFFGAVDVSTLSEALVGVEYAREAVDGTLCKTDVSKAISGATASDITNLLFTEESVL